MTNNSFPSPSSLPTASHLEGLNEEQCRAVITTDGPLLILAGAGTGKTRVLTTRFAHILLNHLAWPEQILSVTFTNKAAREMRERISHILGKPIEGLWLGTFHALCARMLRQHALHVGLERDFTILDADDQLRLLKQIMIASSIDLKRWPAAQLMGCIQLWKDKALLPHDITSAHDIDFANGKAKAIYEVYQNRLKSLNACDFGDLMLHMVTIFRSHPEIVSYYQKRFKYILVDEYQDTNTIQYLWLRLLAKRSNGSSNIACVGDDDQSIYSWRGADVTNILQFEKDFPGATVIRLERNYRSTPRILGAASSIIAHNEKRLGKTLNSALHSEAGDYIDIISASDSDDEARLIAQKIRKLHDNGDSYGSMAILIRAGFLTRSFEESFMRSNIPYQVIGGLRFYERAEIRDSIAYMRALLHPSDDLALERIINTPKRGVGNVALSRLRQASQDTGLSLQKTVEDQLLHKTLKGKTFSALSDLVRSFIHARETLKNQGHVVAVEELLEESGYLSMWRNDQRSVEASGRLDNVRELSVFLPAWEEGIFPSQRSMDEGGLASLEEERRLAYVGLTRAQKRIIISHANSRRIYANWQDSVPSRFIEELPDEHVAKIKKSQKHHSSSFGRNFWLRSEHELPSIKPKNSAYKSSSTKQFVSISIGATVKHKKFGLGVVINIDGDRLNVNFESSGQKNIMAGFVEVVS